ncbi:MAG: glycosyltransferase family 2 protein [Planctomycetes bacterium]|nr:glycosyltransferase family 2 protein [Planctomycetota bacterium]
MRSPQASSALRRLSIVIPVYRGEQSVGPLCERLAEHLGGVYELEIVLVNDGSPDDSAAVCRKLADENAHIVFLDLARNFGEHNAVMAGLAHASGEGAVIMDDDFQNPPSEVIKLVERLDQGVDVVFSRYDVKRHHWFRNLGSSFNNAVASVMLKKPRDLYLSSFKALNRFTIDEITRYTGPYPYVDGLILRTTRNYDTVLVRHDEREEGRSSYTLRKLVRLWLNMFTNFSILPLRVASIAGLSFAAIGLVLAVAFAIERLNNPDMAAGWASLICTLLIVAGVQLFALGMIGEYLGRLFLKDNGSPQYVVRRSYNVREPGGDA